MSSMFCTKIYKCRNVDWCARDFNPKSDEPKCFEPLTNADRIRAMADGELANAIWHDFGNSPWCYPTVTEGVLECNIIDARCEECILNWLKQAVEE